MTWRRLGGYFRRGPPYRWRSPLYLLNFWAPVLGRLGISVPAIARPRGDPGPLGLSQGWAGWTES